MLKLKKNITAIKVLFFKKDLDNDKALVFSKTSFGEKITNTLLVTCIMVTKLNDYM